MSAQHTIIFDFDGTLADTLQLMLKLYNQHADEFKALPIDESELDELRELGYKKSMKWKKVRYSVLPKMALQILREMREHMDDIKPHDGIIPMLRDLRQQGISIGILTSNDDELVSEFLQSHDFPPFDFVVSEKRLFSKEKALKRIMKKYKLHREQVIYVGDETRDVVASKKAGVKVFGVSWGLAGRRGLEKSSPDRIADTATELQNYLLKAIEY